MIKSFGLQSWTCKRRLQKQLLLRICRQNSTARAPSTRSPPALQDYAPYWNADSGERYNDRPLRDAFDSLGFWESFSIAGFSSAGGLVQNAYLKTPAGFQTFTHATLSKCKSLVQHVLCASSLEDYRSLPRDLDRLSDLLCRVIDLSDFMRATHSEPAYVNAAHNAYATMFEYMNELNTTTGLNQKLSEALAMPEVVKHWSEEEHTVARNLMKEFSNSAIDLPPDDRRKFVELSNEINVVGTDFVNGIQPAQEQLSFTSTELYGLDPILVKNATKWGRVKFAAHGYEAHQALHFAKSESVRRVVHTAQRTSSKAQIGRLETLIRRRSELAKLSGHQSYAHMTLSDKMAKSPEAVEQFLNNLNSTNKPIVNAELARLQTLNLGSNSSSAVQPWNYAYSIRQVEQRSQEARTSKSRHLARLSSFFSLGTVMQGISRVFTRLYGVSLVPRPSHLGETWSKDVRCLDVVHETNTHLGVIYCDLFSRPNKSPNPAHFTLRCSRELTDEEIAAGVQGELVNDGMPTNVGLSRITGKQALFQLPVLALVCDFPHVTRKSPSLLSLHNVVTLFHEMGHAIHSILGRTSLQAISGTRCPTDFAELPSVLMESFATDPAVLKLYARHWETNQALTSEMIEAMLKENATRTTFAGATQIESQILMSFLDQAYHSIPCGRELDSTAMYHDIWNRHGSLAPESEMTSWQGYFGHLFGYGATYYSYLFDRAIARRVWQETFRAGQNDGSIDRAAGERFKETVLKWGGGRDPWICLEDLLGNGEGILAEGSEMAMLEVGKWGVGVGEGDAVGI